MYAVPFVFFVRTTEASIVPTVRSQSLLERPCHKFADSRITVSPIAKKLPMHTVATMIPLMIFKKRPSRMLRTDSPTWGGPEHEGAVHCGLCSRPILSRSSMLMIGAYIRSCGSALRVQPSRISPTARFVILYKRAAAASSRIAWPFE
jgi:hypothetical protein